ncbi:MAG: hypothetical protein OYH77_00555, partial [Pseudomonadota bacterium]|nr:hypothetical protein [Pseudomonadota bacterium]
MYHTPVSACCCPQKWKHYPTCLRYGSRKDKTKHLEDLPANLVQILAFSARLPSDSSHYRATVSEGSSMSQVVCVKDDLAAKRKASLAAEQRIDTDSSYR